MRSKYWQCKKGGHATAKISVKVVQLSFISIVNQPAEIDPDRRVHVLSLDARVTGPKNREQRHRWKKIIFRWTGINITLMFEQIHIDGVEGKFWISDT